MIELLVFVVSFGGSAAFIAAGFGAFVAVLDGPWWRNTPIPGQYCTLPGLGPVLVKEVSKYGCGVRFIDAIGNTASIPLAAFKWQARPSTREAFDVAATRERILKGGAP